MAADARAQRTAYLLAIDYSKFVRKPTRVSASGAAFAMNRAGSGHVDLANRFSTAVGLGPPRMGINAAQALLNASTPYVYLTLTNDHQPLTEGGHDRTLIWERNKNSRDAAGIFIGPPGKNMLEGPRKAIFCELSEGLAKRTGDP